MTSIYIHDKAAVSYESRTFRPERWLPLESEGTCVQKYLATSVMAHGNVWVCSGVCRDL